MADSRLTDPLGRNITLHDRTWYAHIVKGHPDVKQLRTLAERCIRDPVEIRISFSDPACRLFFGTGPRPSLMMMVVADVDLGIVKTAHLAKKVSGGAVEWSKPTR